MIWTRILSGWIPALTVVIPFMCAMAGSYYVTWYYRYRKGMPLTFKQLMCFDTKKKGSPKSTCLTCGHLLMTRDVIPIISFLVCRGKCRYCGTKIGYGTILSESVGFLVGLIIVMIWLG